MVHARNVEGRPVLLSNVRCNLVHPADLPQRRLACTVPFAASSRSRISTRPPKTESHWYV